MFEFVINKFVDGFSNGKFLILVKLFFLDFFCGFVFELFLLFLGFKFVIFVFFFVLILDVIKVLFFWFFGFLVILVLFFDVCCWFFCLVVIDGLDKGVIFIVLDLLLDDRILIIFFIIYGFFFGWFKWRDGLDDFWLDFWVEGFDIIREGIEVDINVLGIDFLGESFDFFMFNFGGEVLNICGLGIGGKDFAGDCFDNFWFGSEEEGFKIFLFDIGEEFVDIFRFGFGGVDFDKLGLSLE